MCIGIDLQLTKKARMLGRCLGVLLSFAVLWERFIFQMSGIEANRLNIKRLVL